MYTLNVSSIWYCLRCSHLWNAAKDDMVFEIYFGSFCFNFGPSLEM